MNILLSFVALITTVISLALIIAGIKNNVKSCYKIGGQLLTISIFTAICYFMDWLIPVIGIFGIAGTILTLIGCCETYNKKTNEISIVFCVMGLIFYIISFYTWYQAGWYTSMAFTTFTLSCLSFLDSIQDEKNRINVMQLLLSSAFLIVSIYVCLSQEINVLPIILGGLLVSLILKAIWKVVYEKNYGIENLGVMNFIAPSF